jgi:outer membrane protein assembly factor BamB
MTDERNRPPGRLLGHLLEAYWDGLVGGVPAGPETEQLDPSLARTVWRVHALDDAPPIDARFKQRLWEDLRHGTALTTPRRLFPPGPAAKGRGNGRVAAPPWSGVQPRPHQPLRQLVATLGLVALLLLALGAVVVFYRENQQPATIPAVQDTATPAPPPAENWPIYRGDPGRTGNVPVHGPTGISAELWHYQTQGRIDSVPIVVDGVLYVAGEDGNVYALDAKTGAAIWATSLGAGSGSSPAFSNGVVYVGDDNNDLHAIDAATGREVWKATGSGWVDPGPVVDDVLYAGNADGTFQAIQASDGEVLWRTPLGGGSSRAAGYADGLVVVGSGDGRVNALDARTGEPKWSYSLGTGIVGTVAVAGGVVYGTVSGGTASSVVALDAVGGQQLWSFGTLTDADLRSPAIGDGLVYTVSGDGTVYALDAATGTQRWSAPAGSVVRAAPALAGNTLYVVADAGKLLALDAATGAERWRFDFGSTNVSGPVVAGGLLYLATDGGTVVAVGGADVGTAAGSPVAPTATASVAAPTEAAATASPSAGAPARFLWTSMGSAADNLVSPQHIRISPDGRIWVPDLSNRFFIFGLDGTLQEIWGTSGSGPGQFKFSRNGASSGSITFAPDGSFYVVDSLNYRIQRFDRTRRYLGEWGTRGAGAGQFLLPVGLAIAPDGSLLVTDYRRGDVQRFDSSGTFLGAFDGATSPDGKLRGPIGIAVDGGGSVYVTEFDGSRVRVFDGDGNEIGLVGAADQAFGGFAFPVDAVVDRDGYLYVADLGNNRIAVFDPRGRFLFAWGTFGTGDGQFRSPDGVAVNRGGAVYVSEGDGNRIQKFQILASLPSAG